MVQPFLKWAGGKRQLLSQIEPYVPELDDDCTYYEPFLGAGALLFELQPRRAVVNDINSELINVYEVIQSKVLFEKLIEELRKHKENNSSEYFYEVRAWDRSEDYKKRSMVERAARFIYLNKTCFNGLYRVNSKGQFNVPFGKYKNPDILNEVVLRQVHIYLSYWNVQFHNKSFEQVVENAKAGDFVYFDPPYDPLNETSSFTSYALEGFGKEEQWKLLVKKLF